MDAAVDSSLGGDEGYAAWLQWREMERAKRWREELNKGLDSEDSESKKQTSTGQENKHTVEHKTTPITNGRHSPPHPLPRSKPPQNLPLHDSPDVSPPPKPPRKHHTTAAAASGSKRKVHSHLKRHRRMQSPTSSVFQSLVNPRMTVMQSILGSSVAPLLLGASKGERILCLDGGGIKVRGLSLSLATSVKDLYWFVL